MSDIKQWLRKHAALSLMLIFPILGALYALINDNPSGPIYNLVTDLDRHTPFIKYFALPYSIWIFYIYACLIYFYMKDRKVYYHSIFTYTVCALICYMVYLVYQTTVPRPVIVGDDVFSNLMRFIYNRDQPFNCFPSIHVFSSYMVATALFHSKFKNWANRIIIYGMSALIIASTLFVKQHVILDVIAGVFLAELVYRVALRYSWLANAAAKTRSS